MRSIAEHALAVERVLHSLTQRQPEIWRDRVAPASSVPRVLARDVHSPLDLPPFDNSQMDGYAVRAAEVEAGVPLAVAGRVPAGTSVTSLAKGSAAPIMTGAAIPDGATAVIPIEDATPDRFQPNDGARTVVFSSAVSDGLFVRKRGSDQLAGSLLLAAGTPLRAAQWGVLAAAGVTEVPLVARLRVLVVSTGDELVERDAPLRSGAIHDANSVSLSVALADAGAQVVGARVVADDAHELRRVLAEYAGDIDLILTTGGVSMGAYEVLRDAFEGVGVEFVSVAMQPGGPQGLGVATVGSADVPVVAFPGNPVSALVSFEMFLRPILRSLHGLSPHRPQFDAPLGAALRSPIDKHQIRRGRLTSSGDVELVGGASSHLISHYAASTLLVHVPVGVSELAAGDTVNAWRIDE